MCHHFGASFSDTWSILPRHFSSKHVFFIIFEHPSPALFIKNACFSSYSSILSRHFSSSTPIFHHFGASFPTLFIQNARFHHFGASFLDTFHANAYFSTFWSILPLDFSSKTRIFHHFGASFHWTFHPNAYFSSSSSILTRRVFFIILEHPSPTLFILNAYLTDERKMRYFNTLHRKKIKLHVRKMMYTH